MGRIGSVIRIQFAGSGENRLFPLGSNQDNTMEWNWIDRLCVVFYYAIGPIAILWLFAIAHTIFCFE